jgi:hypothetical protein
MILSLQPVRQRREGFFVFHKQKWSIDSGLSTWEEWRCTSNILIFWSASISSGYILPPVERNSSRQGISPGIREAYSDSATLVLRHNAFYRPAFGVRIGQGLSSSRCISRLAGRLLPSLSLFCILLLQFANHRLPKAKTSGMTVLHCTASEVP